MAELLEIPPTIGTPGWRSSLSAPAAVERTMEFTPPRGTTPGASRPRIEMIEGRQPDLASEIQVLLRRRLRAAILLLFAGASLFLSRAILFETDSLHYAWVRAIVRIQGLGVLSLGGLLALVFSRRALSLVWLRRTELAAFGLVGFCLALAQHLGVVANALDGRAERVMFNFLLNLALWFVIIFTYAMFIPNSGRRAAAVITTMGVVPLAILAIDMVAYAPVRASIPPNTGFLIAIMLGFAAASATYGAYTIGRLRMDAFIARRLGQYRLRKLLATGGMGEVYLAEHLLLKRPCAIKLIHPHIARDPKIIARFEREVRATAELTHWNTVEIFDYGRTEDGVFYYVMEYLPGLNLGELVDRTGPLPPERVIHFLRQICGALREAHARGLIHRDIKPANILAAERGGMLDVAKLLDFGIVEPKGEAALRLTGDGAVTGSPLYMSPEQAKSTRRLDGRCDVYSLGAVAYFLLIGEPPFLGDGPIDILVRHASQPPTPLSHLRADVPADLERVVMRCLAKLPEDRFVDVQALDQALAACDCAGEWTEQRAAAWWRSVPQVLQPTDWAKEQGMPSTAITIPREGNEPVSSTELTAESAPRIADDLASRAFQ